jgi:membrane protein YqaA with SNARE-associated domain
MTKRNSFFANFWHNLKGHHRSNQKRGLYGYMWWTSLKIVALYFVIVVPLVIIGKRVIDLNQVFHYLTDNFTDGFVLITFFVSESFLGMIPPDLFMIWATKFDSPFLILMILGLLSYIGGIFSYLIGYWLSKRPKIKAYSERALNKYILLAGKWGGAFIIIAALFPFSPFSMVVIAVSLLKYPFRLYLLFGLSRIARFVFQGLLYSGIFNMDAIIGYFSR